MEKIIRETERVLTLLAGLLMTVMLVIVISNVILRYVFTSAINWAVEISDYAMIWAVLLASVSLLCSDEHLAINALEDHLKGVSKMMVKLLVYMGCGIFGAAFLYSSVMLFSVAGTQVASTVRWLPMSYVYAVLPVTGALIVFVSVTKVIVTVRKQLGNEGGTNS